MSGAVVILSSSPPRTFARSPTPADTLSPLRSLCALSNTKADDSGQFKDSRRIRDGFTSGFGSARALLATKVGAENIPLLSPRKDGSRSKSLKRSEELGENKEETLAEERPKHFDESLSPMANPRHRDSHIKSQELETSGTELKHTEDEHDISNSRYSSPLSREKAIPRRLDWTPVKPSTHALETPHSEDRAVGFTNDLMEFYAFNPSATTGIETTATSDTDEARLSRRRIDLVMTTEAKPSSSSCKAKPCKILGKGGNNVKAKSATKKPLTITGLATSNYGDSRLKETKIPPILEYLTATQVGAGTEADLAVDGSSKVSRSKSPAKKARPAKKAPAKTRLKSPTSAIKTTLEQPFLFGPASQLARDESPSLTRDTLEALRRSECFSSDPISPQLTQPVSIESVSPKFCRGTSRFVKRRNLWSAAGRDEDNALLQVDTVDLTDSPAVRLALAGKDVLVQPISRNDQDIIALDNGPSRRLQVPLSKAQEAQSLVDIDDIVTPRLPKSVNTPTQARVRLYHTSRTLEQPQQGADAHRQHDDLQSGAKSVASDAKPTMPSYVGFSDHELKKQISAYGFKAVKKREAMIELLERCWESKHGIHQRHDDENASNDATTHADLLSKIHDVSTRPAPKFKKSRAKRKSETGDTNTVKEPKKRKKAATKSNDTAQQGGKGSRKRMSKALSDAKIVDVDDLDYSTNPNIKEGHILETPTVVNNEKPLKHRSGHAAQTLVTPPSTVPQPKCTPSQAHDSSRAQSANLASRLDGPVGGGPGLTPEQTPMPDILSQIRAAIYRLPDTQSVNGVPRNHQVSPTWHEKILMYDPIVLEELTVWLNTEGFKAIGEDREVSPTEVRMWCEQNGVCCYGVGGGWRGRGRRHEVE